MGNKLDNLIGAVAQNDIIRLKSILLLFVFQVKRVAIRIKVALIYCSLHGLDRLRAGAKRIFVRQH